MTTTKNIVQDMHGYRAVPLGTLQVTDLGVGDVFLTHNELINITDTYLRDDETFEITGRHVGRPGERRYYETHPSTVLMRYSVVREDVS